MTSYDSAYDEFGESVWLDRGMLHAVHTVLPLLTYNGHLRVDKRSCSLPNLLSDSSARPASYPGPSEGGVSLLSGWLQTEEEGKRNSANLESISEEAPAEREADVNSIQGYEIAGGSSPDVFTNNDVQISSNGDATSPSFHYNGCVNNTYTAEALVGRDMPRVPGHRQNGHLIGKARLKRTGTDFEKSCGLKTVNRFDVNEQASIQDSRQVSTGKPLHLKTQFGQRTANFAEESFDRLSVV